MKNKELPTKDELELILAKDDDYYVNFHYPDGSLGSRKRNIFSYWFRRLKRKKLLLFYIFFCLLVLALNLWIDLSCNIK